MRSKRTLRGIAALVSISILSACGGGGGGGSRTPAITGPSAGEFLGGTQAITWISPANRDTVEIRLSTDGGATFPTVLAAAAPDTGTFSWDTTGGADGAQYRIQITPTDTTPAVLASFSNAGDFTVDNTLPVITLVSPQAGSVFGGPQALIRWDTVDDNRGTVSIQLSTDSGGTFGTDLSADAPDSGEFRFDATGLAEGTTYRIRLTPKDLASNVGATDASAGNAEIDNTPPTITLTSPVGGETWSATHNVTYTRVDNNPGTVEVLLSPDSGLTFPTTLALDATSAGPFAWNTGLTPDGSTYRIRVIGVDQAGNRSAPSDSPADFSLENIVLAQNALFLDVNLNGVLDAGDRLILAFNEEIVLNGPTEADFEMFVGGDSLGAGGTILDLNEVGELAIVLNAGMGFKARGEFDGANLAAGDPSGIDVASPVTADSIENLLGTDVAGIGGVDIEAGFVEARQEAGSDKSTSVAGGDFDGDGDMDFAIGRSAGLGIALRERNALGEYPLAGASPLGTDTVNGVAMVDLDGDGDLDIASAVAGANRIWLGDGTGGFVDSGQLLGASISQAVAAGDLDGDGDLDLVFGNDIAGPARAYLNNGSGVFTGTGQSFNSSNTVDLDLGDVDGDGDLDILAGNQGGVGGNLIWLNDGAGTFTQGSEVLVTQTRRIRLGDLDGDGDLDAFIGVNGQSEVAFNNGSGTFTTTSQFLGNGDVRGLALFDNDGDGDLDALIGKYFDRDEIWNNDGDGVFSSRLPQNIGSGTTADVFVADLDLDGDMDYFAPGAEINDDLVWHNSLTGVFGSVTL
ncbi:MAG: VCBS repeat-containing protein, partial [Planctomycetota bacterium]|nr:VCBS repeat-containing protein [Planctomycetota bacterium]